MNSHHLQVFLTVARRLSYSRAAEELFISQPAVSRHVDSLEKELGVELLGQVGNRVFLTEAGTIVSTYAHKLFVVEEEMKRALSELQSLERGYLRLGASSTPGIYVLPALVAEYRRRYPGIEVSITITNCRGILEGVIRYDQDLGFLGGHAVVPSLELRPYLVDRLVLITPPDHPLGHLKSARLEQLTSEPFVLREAGSCTRQMLEEELAPRGYRLRRAVELNGSEAVKRAVAAGVGLAVVSQYSVEQEVQHRLIQAVPIEGARLERQSSIVANRESRPSAAALAFLALAEQPHLRPRGWEAG